MKIMKRLSGALAIAVIAFLAWQFVRMSPDVALGSASPDVTLTTLEGGDLPLADLRGQLVLLDFWTST